MAVKKIIAIASAKGGVGKSSVCSHIAFHMAKDHKVGILDADIYGPNQHLIFNLENHKQSIKDKDGSKLFEPCISNNIKINGMGFILDSEKAAIWRGPMLSGAIKQLMDVTIWGSLDYLFIDMPPGTGDAYLTVSSELKPDAAILITTNSTLSISDTLKSKITFDKLKIPIPGFIVNMEREIKNSEYLLDPQYMSQLLNLNYIDSIPDTDIIRYFQFQKSKKLLENINKFIKNEI